MMGGKQMTQARSSQKIREGTWFAFPLARGGFCVGLVAREERGAILAAYFFGAVWNHIPTLDELRELRPSDAIRVLRVGALGFSKGAWVAIGSDPAWDRQKWPLPKFLRKNRMEGTAWIVEYSDTNPNEVLSETPADFDMDLETDALFGHLAAESVMNSVLDKA